MQMFPPDAKTMRRPEASHRASATEDRREERSHAGAEPQKFHEKLPRDLFMFNSSGLLRKEVICKQSLAGHYSYFRGGVKERNTFTDISLNFLNEQMYRNTHEMVTTQISLHKVLSFV